MKKQNTLEELKPQSNDARDYSEQLAIGAPVRIFESEHLFGPEHEIGIIHQGAMYRLRVTRGGKLILNK